MADTTLSASITPSATSSKVLVLLSQAGCFKEVGNTGSGMNVRLLRGSTTLIDPIVSGGYTGTSIRNDFGNVSCAYLDSPSSTSAVTYKTQFANIVNASGVTVQANSAVSTLVLIEIGA